VDLSEQRLSEERHRDLVGRKIDPWVRRILLSVLVAVAVLALLNVFGQEPSTSTASAPEAALEVSAPRDVRGGLLFQARLTVEALGGDLKEPKLVLSPGWFEAMTLNTTEPQPKEEFTDDGRVVLGYDEIPAGRRLVVWLAFQANPANLGSQRQEVELFDGTRRLLGLSRSITVFP
jgi:hypothetical protein